MIDTSGVSFGDVILKSWIIYQALKPRLLALFPKTVQSASMGRYLTGGTETKKSHLFVFLCNDIISFNMYDGSDTPSGIDIVS